MSIRHLALLAVVALVGGGLSACNEQALPQAPGASSTASAPVVIVDVDAVARALGRDVERQALALDFFGRDVAMREQLQSTGEELAGQLRALAQDLKGQFEAERARIGDNPTQQQRENLARIGIEAQARVQQEQAAAQRKAQELQVQLARQIQDEVRPVAGAIARERGAVVAISSTFVLWAESSTDITGAVIERMKAQPTQ